MTRSCALRRRLLRGSMLVLGGHRSCMCSSMLCAKVVYAEPTNPTHLNVQCEQ